MLLINGLELYSDSFTPSHDKIRSHTINQKRYRCVLLYNLYVYSDGFKMLIYKHAKS